MSKEVEVIARKSGKADSGLFIGIGMFFMAVDLFLWIITGMGGTFNFKKEVGWALLIIAMLLFGMIVAIFFLVLGIKLKVKYSNLPDELIKYQDGELIFGDGYRCKITDIVSVDCFKVERDGTPQMKAMRANPDAWISVTTKDRTIKYEQVEAVRDAYEKLMRYIELNAEVGKS